VQHLWQYALHYFLSFFYGWKEYMKVGQKCQANLGTATADYRLLCFNTMPVCGLQESTHVMELKILRSPMDRCLANAILWKE